MSARGYALNSVCSKLFFVWFVAGRSAVRTESGGDNGDVRGGGFGPDETRRRPTPYRRDEHE